MRPSVVFAVQAAGCAPIVRAFEEGRPVRAWERPATRAGGIADPLAGYEADGDRTLAAVRASGGAATAVADVEIERAASDLARRDGLAVELAAAAAEAGRRRLAVDGRITPGEVCVVVLTGHALKDPPGAGEDASLGLVAPGDVEAARLLVRELMP